MSTVRIDNNGRIAVLRQCRMCTVCVHYYAGVAILVHHRVRAIWVHDY